MKEGICVDYKIIIVEDEKIIRDSLMKFEWDTVQSEIIASFDNAITALEFLKENAVDAILTDIRMPMMDGIEFIKRVRKDFPEISIVCLSGHSDYAYLRECMQLGVKDYILKPTDKKELLQVFCQLAEEKRRVTETSNKEDDVVLQKYVIVKAMEYIEQNYQRSIKLVDVADSVCLNPVYFSHVFKKQTGVRFVDYLADYRIQKAIELMQDPALTIGAIAGSVGFYSSRYFAETFKKRKGMTPSEYRNKVQNKGE